VPPNLFRLYGWTFTINAQQQSKSPGENGDKKTGIQDVAYFIA
jgi:hypothetical protein